MLNQLTKIPAYYLSVQKDSAIGKTEIINKIENILSWCFSHDFVKFPMLICIDIIVGFFLLVIARILVNFAVDRTLRPKKTKTTKKSSSKRKSYKLFIFPHIGMGRSYFGGERRKKRIRTFGTMANSLTSVIVFFVLVMLILNQVGVKGTMAVGLLGFIGVALGLGTQTIAKDVAFGVLIILEDQYGVGDRVKINDMIGVVKDVSLRTTTLFEATPEEEIEKKVKKDYVDDPTLASLTKLPTILALEKGIIPTDIKKTPKKSVPGITYYIPHSSIVTVANLSRRGLKNAPKNEVN